ncbi:hypothetical protein GCM10007874_53820 [Labrys miyagiensis]|uniref:Uncharacterized protein n=1 Tax=Labrys miyagiensis TaxID=346912 RepID=A0ABQ6CUG6_9HYPH|nr:hypothetical protein GCM10007874_53820 [Labrys miyagiensis]
MLLEAAHIDADPVAVIRQHQRLPQGQHGNWIPKTFCRICKQRDWQSAGSACPASVSQKEAKGRRQWAVSE